VTGGIGSVLGSPSLAGKTMTVDLTGVADAQKITVTLSQVVTSASSVPLDVSVSVNMLIGDNNADKSVGKRRRARDRERRSASP
jgi:hypothetical protein